MLCPDCNRNYDETLGGCPRCGVRKGVVKTSTILISAGEVESVYRSVDEVPDSLRQDLIRSTNGLNAQTIVIADREGRKEIARAIRNLPSTAAKERPVVEAPEAAARPLWRRVIGVVILLLAAAAVWFIFRKTG